LEQFLFTHDHGPHILLEKLAYVLAIN